ncbi:MAG: hypothetical protein EOP84_08710 [Verrucomicrobiaceae bacterium]|nr:MAG: hypothetical protein EOP84_08710 [Verrucomicrobiaceae bacterium]
MAWTEKQISLALAEVRSHDEANSYAIPSITQCNEALTYGLLHNYPDLFDPDLFMVSDVTTFPARGRVTAFSKTIRLTEPLTVPRELDLAPSNSRFDRVMEEFLPALLQMGADSLVDWIGYHRADGKLCCPRLPLYGSWLRNAQTFNHEVMLLSSFGLINAGNESKYCLPADARELRLGPW